MTVMEAVVIVITILVIPYVVQLIKREAIKDNKARWLAICISLAAGIAAGLIGGIPVTTSAWVTCIFTVIGGVQVAYAAFKSVGITSKWLDALAEIKVNHGNTNN